MIEFPVPAPSECEHLLARLLRNAGKLDPKQVSLLCDTAQASPFTKLAHVRQFGL